MGCLQSKADKEKLAAAQLQLKRITSEKERVDDELIHTRSRMAQIEDEVMELRKQKQKLETDLTQKTNEIKESQERYDESQRQAMRSNESEKEAFRDRMSIEKEAMENKKKRELDRVKIDELEEKNKRLMEELGVLKTNANALREEVNEGRSNMLEIDRLRAELDRALSEISRLQAQLATAEDEFANAHRLHQEAETVNAQEISQLRKIVEELEYESEEQYLEDPRVYPLYERLQRCLEVLNDKPNKAGQTEVANQMEMLHQSHAALQQLKSALENERDRNEELKDNLDQERMRSQLLLKVIRHFKRKLQSQGFGSSDMTAEDYEDDASAIESYAAIERDKSQAVGVAY